MEKANINGLIKIFTRELSLTTWSMEKAFYKYKLAITREIGKMIKCMEMVFVVVNKVNIRVNGNKARCMAMVFALNPTENMMVNGFKDKDLVKAYFNLPKEIITRDNGKIIWDKDLECLRIQKETSTKENG